MRADDYEQIINYDWPQDEGYVLPSVQTNVSKVSEEVLPWPTFSTESFATYVTQNQCFYAGGKLIRFCRATRII